MIDIMEEHTITVYKEMNKHYNRKNNSLSKEDIKKIAEGAVFVNNYSLTLTNFLNNKSTLRELCKSISKMLKVLHPYMEKEHEHRERIKKI